MLYMSSPAFKPASSRDRNHNLYHYRLRWWFAGWSSHEVDTKLPVILLSMRLHGSPTQRVACKDSAEPIASAITMAKPVVFTKPVPCQSVWRTPDVVDHLRQGASVAPAVPSATRISPVALIARAQLRRTVPLRPRPLHHGCLLQGRGPGPAGLPLRPGLGVQAAQPGSRVSAAREGRWQCRQEASQLCLHPHVRLRVQPGSCRGPAHAVQVGSSAVTPFKLLQALHGLYFCIFGPPARP